MPSELKWSIYFVRHIGLHKHTVTHFLLQRSPWTHSHTHPHTDSHEHTAPHEHTITHPFKHLSPQHIIHILSHTAPHKHTITHILPFSVPHQAVIAWPPWPQWVHPPLSFSLLLYSGQEQLAPLHLTYNPWQHEIEQLLFYSSTRFHLSFLISLLLKTRNLKESWWCPCTIFEAAYLISSGDKDLPQGSHIILTSDGPSTMIRTWCWGIRLQCFQSPTLYSEWGRWCSYGKIKDF